MRSHRYPQHRVRARRAALLLLACCSFFLLAPIHANAQLPTAVQPSQTPVGRSQQNQSPPVHAHACKWCRVGVAATATQFGADSNAACVSSGRAKQGALVDVSGWRAQTRARRAGARAAGGGARGGLSNEPAAAARERRQQAPSAITPSRIPAATFLGGGHIFAFANTG